jgi:hypothetical protein
LFQPTRGPSPDEPGEKLTKFRTHARRSTHEHATPATSKERIQEPLWGLAPATARGFRRGADSAAAAGELIAGRSDERPRSDRDARATTTRVVECGARRAGEGWM